METVNKDQEFKADVVDLTTGAEYKLLDLSQSTSASPLPNAGPVHINTFIRLKVLRKDDLVFEVYYNKKEQPFFKIILPGGDLLL